MNKQILQWPPWGRINWLLERFSIECGKTKTKAITMSNKRNNAMSQSELEATTQTEAKRGKTLVAKSRLVLILHVIG